jgi:hypothetical protein
MSEKSLDKDLSGLSLTEDHGTKVLQSFHNILKEIDTFDEVLKREKRKDQMSLRQFRTRLQSDLRGLEKEASDAEKHDHKLNSTNISYYESVWDVAKRSSGVMSILKRGGQDMMPDVVADGGRTWIKVSTLSERRLLFEMAKEGWIWDESSDDDVAESGFSNEGHAEEAVNYEDVAEISLFKTAKKLVGAAKGTWVQYQHPKVVLILTKIKYGSISHVDTLLNIVKSLGLEIIAADEFAATPTPSIEEAKLRMAKTPTNHFSDTLNLDCTILLALVSDISHANQVNEAPWFNNAVRRQMQIEENERLLPEVLWPTLDGKHLVCTKIAANRMQEITNYIGTDTEKARMKLLLDDTGRSSEEIRKKMQELCHHEIPDGWMLPVKICEFDVNDRRLPSIARTVAKELTDMNKSVFLFGWATGYTTITSNRGAVRVIEHAVTKNTNEEVGGPDIWVSSVSRSLLAKEKDRKV